MEYRQLFDSDVWHWRPECQHWPSSTDLAGFRAVNADKGRPSYGELCNECLGKEKAAEA